MTLTAALADAYRRLGFGTSPGSEVTTRLTAFANDAHKEILNDPVFSRLKRFTVPFATYASVSSAPLPRAATKAFSVVDRSNDYKLEEVSLDWIREQDPGQDFTTGTPQCWAVKNYSSPIARQPSNSSQLLVDSTAAGDTGTAYIEYIDSNGDVVQASVTMTGTTAVNLGGSDVVAVIDFYLSAAAAGQVTLVEDSEGGTELARIGVGDTRARYTLLEIFPTPSSALTLYADVEIFVTDLVNGTDEFLVPDDFREAIVHGIRRREFEKQDKDKEENRAERARLRALSPLKFKVHQYVTNRTAGHGWSQLGPYYPAGS